MNPSHQPVVGGQGVGELRQVLDGVEQLAAAVAEGLHGLRQVDGSSRCRAGPCRRSAFGAGREQRVERAVLVDAVGSERLGQVGQARVDPVELDRRAGVRQRDVRAVLAAVGPPVYAGVSWTNRSAASVGVTIAALASAGSLYSASYSISTRTESPSGTTAVTVPTLTPRIRTSVPS